MNSGISVLQPSFFAPVLHGVVWVSSKELWFEKHDHFQKQTYRNRCYIYGANGKQLITVPVLHTKSNAKQFTRDVKIDHSFDWQRNFRKSLEASYRSSPYFEFYEDDINRLLTKKHRYLLDLNLSSFALLNELLDLALSHDFSEKYQDSYPSGDLRFLVNAKDKTNHDFKPYKQVFDDKFGFIENLSMLDLLFNEGTTASQYLEDHRFLLSDI